MGEEKDEEEGERENYEGRGREVKEGRVVVVGGDEDGNMS